MFRNFSVKGIRGDTLGTWLRKASSNSPSIFGFNYYERIANAFYQYIQYGRELTRMTVTTSSTKAIFLSLTIIVD